MAQTKRTITQVLGAQEGARVDLTSDHPNIQVDTIPPSAAVEIGSRLIDGPVSVGEGGGSISAIADDEGTVTARIGDDGQPADIRYYPRLEGDRPD